MEASCCRRRQCRRCVLCFFPSLWPRYHTSVAVALKVRGADHGLRGSLNEYAQVVDFIKPRQRSKEFCHSESMHQLVTTNMLMSTDLLPSLPGLCAAAYPLEEDDQCLSEAALVPSPCKLFRARWCSCLFVSHAHRFVTSQSLGRGPADRGTGSTSAGWPISLAPGP